MSNKPQLTKEELTAIEIKVLEHLGVGKTNAVFRKHLQQHLGIDERKLRLSIEKLRHEKYPIISIGNGYYIAQTQQEVDEFVNYIRERVKNECYMLRDVKLGAKERLGKSIQLPLFMG